MKREERVKKSLFKLRKNNSFNQTIGYSFTRVNLSQFRDGNQETEERIKIKSKQKKKLVKVLIKSGRKRRERKRDRKRKKKEEWKRRKSKIELG